MKYMTQAEPLPNFLKIIAHELRWQMLSTLTRSDLRVQELMEAIQQPANLVSYHLKQLRRINLVTEHHSSADKRDIYYSLNLEQFRALYRETGAMLHPAFVAGNTSIALTKPVRVLVLCTHNTARSQMAESILRHLTESMIDVASAGTHPSVVHPQAVATLAAQGISIDGQRSKHIHEFVGQDFDYVITVCDKVREVCPTFSAQTIQVHWSLPDPVAIETAAQPQAFAEIARQLDIRCRYFLAAITQKENE
jgi:ArsR family transcriptional regulator, arsenate/arsenite/antimonite-responsive transcriptional repressor / arsenate reductase (thioredoxin)